MDIKEIVKLQMVTQMGMGQPNRGDNPQTSMLMSMLYQFVVMVLVSTIDDIVRVLPKLFAEAKIYMGTYFTKRVKETLGEQRPKALSSNSIALSTRHDINTFVMLRVFAKADGSKNSDDSVSEETSGMVDAVLARIAKLDNVPTFNLINKGQVMVTYKEKPIQVTRDIFCKIDNITFTASGNVASIKMTLLSNTSSAAEICTYVKSLYASYLQEIKNSLGNNIQFFDQKQREGMSQLPPTSSEADRQVHKRMLVSSAPRQLSFTMTPFQSNKQFSNIYGDEIRGIERRVRFFLENRDWYDRKGVPYQLGILLSGIPGAGKTSAIRAIANLTKRHIINVNFANITTGTQLKNLFFSDKLQVYSDTSMGDSNPYFIPVEQRLYVLEEIDAIGDIVRQRDPSLEAAHTVHDELTLADILTVLDGTMESPGRIVVMTTNHPEVLDNALIRPGRIDEQVHFNYASRATVAEMWEGYLERVLPVDLMERVPDRVLSPAEVGQVLFRHFNGGCDDEAVVADLQHAATEAVNKRLALDNSKHPHQEGPLLGGSPFGDEVHTRSPSLGRSLGQRFDRGSPRGKAVNAPPLGLGLARGSPRGEVVNTPPPAKPPLGSGDDDGSTTSTFDPQWIRDIGLGYPPPFPEEATLTTEAKNKFANFKAQSFSAFPQAPAVGPADLSSGPYMNQSPSDGVLECLSSSQPFITRHAAAFD